jgi:hypothetical protein
VVLKLNDKKMSMPNLAASEDAKEMQKHSLVFAG